MKKNRTKERIKISALKQEVALIGKDYEETVKGFNELMERASEVGDEFPDGFMDAFIITVLISVEMLQKHGLGKV